MDAQPAQRVELVPVDRITVVNPRVRNKKSFEEIVANIAEVGLKKPITVSLRPTAEGPAYDLVCGQGRLEAFKTLGEAKIPALIVNADPADCLVASLVENLARRQHRALDILYDIGGMKARGYSLTEIAAKTGLSYDYVYGVTRLLEKAEHRLLRAVESGRIPVSVAVEIAEADDHDVQAALQHAYESNLLRGKNLLAARRIADQRRLKGKGKKSELAPRRSGAVTAASLIRAYQEDTERKRVLIAKADRTRSRLHFIIEALGMLLAEEPFRTLLRQEGIESIPRPLADRMSSLGGVA